MTGRRFLSRPGTGADVPATTPSPQEGVRTVSDAAVAPPLEANGNVVHESAIVQAIATGTNVVAARAKRVLTPYAPLLDEMELQAARDLGVEVGGDTRMEQAWRKLNMYANTPSTMLIRGESGTGKEPFSQIAHTLRGLKDKPLMTINCAAISDGILESELFGHKKGAFTGAIENRKGKFEEADGGTVFLDEVGDMPLGQQAKLLRVLENGEIVPVGSNTPVKVNVKVVCATNRPLEGMVKEGKFRRDLFHRLQASQIVLPAWRDRRMEHREAVLDYLLARVSTYYKKDRAVGVTAKTQELLLSHPFPGNVRELKHLLQRMYLFAEGRHGGTGELEMRPEDMEMAMNEHLAGDPNDTFIRMGDLGVGPLQTTHVDGVDTHSFMVRVNIPLANGIDDVREQLMTALYLHASTIHRGHMGRTADFLGISRRTATNYKTLLHQLTHPNANGNEAPGEEE